MKSILILACALIAGGLIPLQSAVNAKFGQAVPHPLHATFVSFLGGLLGIIVLLICLHPPLPTKQSLGEVPWYLYTGGLFGVVFVTTVLMLVPRIGVATMLATALTGQLVVSMLVDHYGWFGAPVHPISGLRVAGLACLMAGVFLIRK
jgi:bacterial/archaeal transporter family-2 protein